MQALKKSATISPISHFASCKNSFEFSNSVLRTIHEFQNEFTFDELFTAYILSVRSILTIDGIQYRYPLLGIQLSDGNNQNPIYNFQLKTTNDFWGDITIYRKEAFSPLELQKMEVLTSLLIHPLKLAIIKASNSLMAEEGRIVGYPNPNFVEQLITREAKLATRERIPMAIVLFNADRFNYIRDISGHVYGDKLLYEIMQVMGNNIRETDLLFRYHGNTFCLILKGVTGLQATRIAERVRSAIDQFSFRHMGNRNLHITISAGIAELIKTDSIDTLVERANKALLLAKKIGRNQSILADGKFVA